MSRNSIIALIIVAALVAFGIVAFVLSDDSTDTDTAQNTSENTQEPTAQTESTPTSEQSLAEFTAEEVAMHNSAEDCWTIIDGSVYDITEYVPRHPGGDEILLACGTDGTSLFNERTTEDGDEIGSGTPHSSNASRQLEAYKIGVLV